MSIEFVEPADPVPVAPPDGEARPSAVAGRLLAAAAAAGAVLVVVAVRAQFYVVDKTSFIVDFDRTTTQDARVPYDAFGHAGVGTVTASGATPGGGASTSTLTVSLVDGVSYAPWWLGIAGLLALAAGWALVRPRSPRPGTVVATLGGVLLGSLGAAWLSIRTVDAESVPQVVFAARPGAGVWLLVAAGGLALVAGVVHATRPPLARLLRGRRRHDVQVSGVDAA